MSCTPPVVHSSCPAPIISYIPHHGSLLTCIPHVLHSSCHSFLRSCTLLCPDSCIPHVLHPHCRTFLMSCLYPVLLSSCSAIATLLSCIVYVLHQNLSKIWEQKMLPIFDNKAFDIEQIRYRTDSILKQNENVQKCKGSDRTICFYFLNK